MKVFIWGCYNQGNFGDDLMGIAFSKLFQNEGCEVACYRLSKSLSDKYSIPTTSSVAEAMDWCDIVVIGGGAFFKQEHETHSMINSDIKALSAELEKSNKKLYCISVGSDNVDGKHQLFQPRKSIIESKNFSGGSVRINRDISKLELKNVEFIEDIILTTPILLKHLGLNDELHESILDGKYVVNFSKKNFLKSIFNPSCWRYLLNGVYFKSHDSDSGIKSEMHIPFIKFYENKDPILSSFALSRSKGVISTKLHVGVAASSFGVGFKSIYGNDKTKVFLEQSSAILEKVDGFYALKDLEKQKEILDKYLLLIKKIVDSK
ncbi:hypothetical protein V9K15_002428 [Vibrio cholerae]|nr:polysaccharide pyruvyl transferase family protein [Vibrio cholerae]ELI9714502.1 hypothetical protein [Vibrio cholerae]